MLRACKCKDQVTGSMDTDKSVSCLHDYEHWLRMHSCQMREQFGNPPSRNPNILGYRLEKLLGRGSFGVVFLAVARETRESYAIKATKRPNAVCVLVKPKCDNTIIVQLHLLAMPKVFNKHRVHNACNAYSIIRERNMLACLHHPFIIRLVDSFQCSQNLYVVTDFMECGCLHDHLRLKKTFRYEEVKFMAAMLVLGIEYMHRMNIVHRDLKPKNILVGKNGWLKISDMGISYALQDASCFITDPKAVGTIGYIAPEIIIHKPYNFAVDWFSLGVIIFELLVGIGPECYRRERYPEARQFEVAFPPEINAVSVDLVRRLLMRNPSFRLGNLRTKVHEVRHHPFFRDVDFIGLLNRTVQVAYQPALDGPNDMYFFFEAVQSDFNMGNFFNQTYAVENQNWFADF